MMKTKRECLMFMIQCGFNGMNGCWACLHKIVELQFFVQNLQFKLMVLVP